MPSVRPARPLLRSLYLRWLVRAVLYPALLAAAVVTLGLIRFPMGAYGEQPFALTVGQPDGGSHTTGFHALVVQTGEPSALLYNVYQKVRTAPVTAGPVSAVAGPGDTAQRASRMSAWAAARRALGAHPGMGVMISGSTAPAPFQAGDILLDVNGIVAPVKAVREELAQGEARATVLRDREVVELLARSPIEVSGDDTRLTQVGLVEPPLVVNGMQGVSGPSAGLALTLAYIDSLTVGDLSGGRRIAVTGAVSPRLDGTDAVTGVGSVPAKVAAAAAAGVDLILVPTGNLPLARRTMDSLGSDIPMLAVSSVQQAIRYLCITGGTSTACPVDQWVN